MGVGAKASTPINYNRTTQKQQRQLQEENQDQHVLSSSQISNVNTINYDDYEYPDPSDNFTWTSQYLDETYDVINTNLITRVRHTGEYYTQRQVAENDPTDIDYNLFAKEYFDPYKDFNKDPCDLYAFEIDGTNKGFRNTNIHIFIKNYIENNTTSPYEYHYAIQVETFTTASNDEQLDDIFTGNAWYGASHLYQWFKKGPLKNQSQYYYNMLVDHQTVGLGGNINLVANKKNYIYAYVKWIWYSNTEGNQYYKNIYKDYDVAPIWLNSNYLQNTEESQEQITDIYIPFNQPTFTPKITTETIDIEGITQEVIDLPGLLWEILSMPFAFFSTAFNLTIFPGTPYQVNISNLILTVFGVLVFIFILKILMKK